MNKLKAKQRRARRTRAMIHRLHQPRLCVTRSANHIRVQLISACGTKTLACASTLEKDIQSKVKHTGNKEAAIHVGTLIAERALQVGIKQIAFDRSGYRYHGRVQALADAARAAGMEF